MAPIADSHRGDIVREKPLQDDAAEVGRTLRTALSDMLDELSEAGNREQRTLQTVLNLSQSATSRLMSSARSSDPLATLARVPGPVGLRKMLRGAARAGISPDCLSRVEAAIRSVEALIDGRIGDRYSLDALLSDWVHESRPGFELRQRAAAFKAMSALRGVQVRTFASTWVIHPSSERDSYDVLQIDALMGCRRVRPTGVMHMTSQHLSPGPAELRVQGLSGRPVKCTEDVLLADFSSLGRARMHTQSSGQVTRTLVHNLPLGRQKGADIVSAMLYPGLHRRTRRSGASRTSGVSATAEPPAQDLVLDVLLHDDVWPGVTPELRVIDTVVRGVAHPDDPIRQPDLLDTLERIVNLGRGTEAFRVAEISQYTELIRYVCDQLGWDDGRLRGYRLKLHYPVYGSQVCFAFPLPQAPRDHVVDESTA